jgi:poly(3-hydroxybutyrate) depolymerase
MRRSLQLGSLVVLSTLALTTLLPACSTDPSPPVQPGPTPPDGTPTTDPPPAPTGTTPPPGPPPEPEWVAPQVATTSAACGGAVLPQAIGTTYTTPGGRTYHVWGPSNYDPNKTYPIVMTFHGWYADGAAHEGWFKMEDYTENEAFVVYPDAVAGLWDLNGTTDLVFFDEMVKQLGETYCINPSRVLAFGFSYGGRFMSQLGCKRAGYVKAIAIGDAGGSNDGVKCGRLPVLVTARTADTDELASWAKSTSLTWASLDRCAATTTPSDPTMNCVSHMGCKTPGNVTFCEDTFFDPAWPKDWNHTVREPYRAFTWQWFKALP